jgi:thymidylate kinase
MIVSIVGIPAVGKTTTIDLLVKNTRNFGVLKEDYPNSITDILQQTYRAKTKHMRHDVQTIFFEHDIRKTYKIKDLQRCHSLVVLDRGLEDTWLVTDFYADQGLIDKKFFQDRYYERIAPFFSDVIIYLCADMEMVAKRSKRRDSLNKGTKRSKNDTFVSDIFVKNNYYYVWHHNNSDCIDIDTTNLPPETVANEVNKTILEANKAHCLRLQK